MNSPLSPSFIASRRQRPLLVPQAGSLGAIGVIRSLGLAGYPVHACASSSKALGLKSRYAHRAFVHPPEHDPEYLEWLRSYVHAEGIQGIIPSEGFYMAIRSEYATWSRFFPDAVSADIAYRCLSKCSIAQFFAASPDDQLRKFLPLSIVVTRAKSLSSGELANLPYPGVIKTDAYWDTRPEREGKVYVARSAKALEALIDASLKTHEMCLIQEMVPGCKATATVVVHKGRVLVDNMKYAAHENPHTGGITALRTIWWHAAIMADALHRLAALGWEGPAMVEYKWDAASGRWWFIELNSRYWATLNVDLLASRDYPRHQLDAHFGEVRTNLGPIPEADRFWCRHTFPDDAGYLMSLLRDRSIPLARKVAALGEAVMLTVDPSVKTDLWFPGDRTLYWHAMRSFITKLGSS